MKVFAISDLHLSTVVDKPMDVFGAGWENHFEILSNDWQSKVGESDVVLMPGDFSWAMRMNEALPDFALFKNLLGKKIILRGNHDYWWNTIGQVRNAIPNDFYALQNDCLRFENVLICGSRGWVCPDYTPMSAEDEKIYLREIERLKLSLASMEKNRKTSDKVVCITHFPPFNARYEENEVIRQLIAHDVHTVVYGHLHGAQSRAELVVKKFGITFYLVSSDLVKNKLTEIVI
ncbi:MAG: metallophosphoesterase [Clostridia bacterium]|nr:metallophosphoesterase [Clostridia bacterium]